MNARTRNRMRSRLPLLALLATLALAGSAQAATFTVNTTADLLPGATNPCNTPGAANCSLRAAISAANGTAALDTIVVPAGTYGLTRGSTNEDNNVDGDLDLLQPVTIQGASAATTIITGATLPSTARDRIFDIHINPGAVGVTLSGLTVTGGNPGNGFGGGLDSNSNVPLVITDSVFTGNTGASFGGGIMMDGTGPMTINGSTISGNTGGDGGGIWTGSDATITNTTISGNTTSGSGGGYNNESGTTTFTNVTIAFNKLAGGASFGGIEDFSSTINFKNTIVSNNDGTQCDSAGNPGFFVSQGNNMEDRNSCGFGQPSDHPNTNAQLAALANNGGPTQTHALPKGSPAVDAGDNAACPATDQRGQARPFDGNDDGVAVCDIGAFELRGPPPSTTTTSATAVSSSGATLNGIVNPSQFLTSYHFEYGTTTAYGNSTPNVSAGAGTSDVPVSAAITGLAPNTVYHYRIVASSAGGATTGGDLTFMTSQALPPPPVLGKTANLAPVKGVVFFRLPLPAKAHARTRFGPLTKLTAARQVPIGTLLQTKRGIVSLTTAKNKTGGTQSGQFSKGTFIVQQSSTNPLTTAVMTGTNLNACSKLPRGGAAKTVVGARRRSRSLFANVHGRFRTRGRNSQASVRGTAFLVKDTCSGTLTSVKRGVVRVRDFTLRKTVTVRKGHKYLARAPKRRH